MSSRGGPSQQNPQLQRRITRTQTVGNLGEFEGNSLGVVNVE